MLSRLQREFREYLRVLGDDQPGMLLEEHQWRGLLSRGPHRGGLIAEHEGSAVGYLLYHEGCDLDRGGPTVYVFDLFVSRSWRRHGVGRALMVEAARLCEANGGTEVIFDVWKRNEAAMKFYLRLGALPVQELQYMHLPMARLTSGARATGDAPPRPESGG